MVTDRINIKIVFQLVCALCLFLLSGCMSSVYKQIDDFTDFKAIYRDYVHQQDSLNEYVVFNNRSGRK